MNKYKNYLLISILVLLLAATLPAGVFAADHGGFHGGGFRGGWGGHGWGGYGWHGWGSWWGGWGPWWGYPYYYGYPYNYPNYYDEPPLVIQPQQQEYIQQGPNQGEQDYYWYFCRKPEGYYPYVKECPGGWMKVVPAPPSEQGRR